MQFRSNFLKLWFILLLQSVPLSFITEIVKKTFSHQKSSLSQRGFFWVSNTYVGQICFFSPLILWHTLAYSIECVTRCISTTYDAGRPAGLSRWLSTAYESSVQMPCQIKSKKSEKKVWHFTQTAVCLYYDNRRTQGNYRPQHWRRWSG